MDNQEVREVQTVEFQTEFDFLDYTMVVDNLVGSNFDEKGQYMPHYGKLNAMRLFYNLCVTNSKFEGVYDHNLTDVKEIIEIAKDENFIIAFNTAIENSFPSGVRFNFSNAYDDAKRIVEQRLSTGERLLNGIENILSSFISTAESILTPDTMDAVKKLSDQIDNGKMDVNEFSDTFLNSDRFRKIFDTEVSNQ